MLFHEILKNNMFFDHNDVNFNARPSLPLNNTRSLKAALQ